MVFGIDQSGVDVWTPRAVESQASHRWPSCVDSPLAELAQLPWEGRKRLVRPSAVGAYVDLGYGWHKRAGATLAPASRRVDIVGAVAAWHGHRGRRGSDITHGQWHQAWRRHHRWAHRGILRETCRGCAQSTMRARLHEEHRDLVIRLQEIKLISGTRHAGEGKQSCIKDNLPRDENPISGKIQTHVAFVIR